MISVYYIEREKYVCTCASYHKKYEENVLIDETREYELNNFRFIWKIKADICRVNISKCERGCL